MSIIELYKADYRAHCRHKVGESDRRRRWLALPRLLANPSLQVVLILRIANASPRATWWLWRNYLLRMHSIDWSGSLKIGPGLEIPHPVGLMLLAGSRIGSDVGLAHNVTFGGARGGGTPTLGDRVTIYPGVVLVGGITIGDDSVISANCVVMRDVPAGRVLTARGVVPLAATRAQRPAP